MRTRYKGYDYYGVLPEDVQELYNFCDSKQA